MGHFKLKNKFNINIIDQEYIIPESDFINVDDKGEVVQFEYIETDENKFPTLPVKPGVWKIIKTASGLDLQPTSFVQDSILDTLVSAKKIEKIIDCFFKNIHLYKEFGMEIAKRNVLIYGEAGLGKSTNIAKAINKYLNEKDVSVIVWGTSEIPSSAVKQFIKSFDYKGVNKLILVAEDIGGMENREYRTESTSSLLSLLDNNEKTFIIPTMIIATTNYPENLEANLANRPGRFDDKIEIEYPTGKERLQLMQFFTKSELENDVAVLIESDKCAKFSPSHLREAYIRHHLRSETLFTTIGDMIKEITLYDKGFSKRKGVGI